MKNQLLALIVLFLLSLGASGMSAIDVNGISNENSCEYDGKSYAIGSKRRTNNHETLICKAYDAIIPQSANRLEKGYSFWEMQNAVTKISTELPRILFSTSHPTL